MSKNSIQVAILLLRLCLKQPEDNAFGITMSKNYLKSTIFFLSLFMSNKIICHTIEVKNAEDNQKRASNDFILKINLICI